MATISPNELTAGRREMAHVLSQGTDYTSPQINAALQALEDWFEGGAKLDAAIDIETAAPGVFSNAQKKKLGGIWMVRKALRELI